LSNIDNKLEHNFKINKKLEELAQTHYKRWFVDFEFPNEKGEPYKSSGGEMVDSELGFIPKGWEVKDLNDIFEFTGGFTFKGNREDYNHKFKIITIKNVQDGIMDFSKVSSIETVPDKVKKDQFLNIGDILVSLTGNVGRICLVNQINCLLNQRVEKIKSKDTFLNGFCYFYFRNNNTYNKLISLSKGSAQQNLSPVEVSKLKIAIPANETMPFIIFDNLVNSVLNNQIQNNKLAELRDLLLPKLMSGEIEVPIEE
jgi:type I restriction enzyme S subunit